MFRQEEQLTKKSSKKNQGDYNCSQKKHLRKLPLPSKELNLHPLPNPVKGRNCIGESNNNGSRNTDSTGVSQNDMLKAAEFNKPGYGHR